MYSGQSEPPQELGLDSELPDVTAIPLEAVLSTDDSTLSNAVLANAVRRLRSELDGDEEVVAGFGDGVS